ncbi:DUF1801 domain-containing protein [Peristeroidobacter soli]|uniref:DUF1801 domain-containing protein n=1 Tax=Peristeroidobacter soli TaxID=2497877 RepID=UPI00101D69E4|nr:DUF1801 domain-containing protein [Peristeroidobacter soli]
MTPFRDPAVKAKFDAYPKHARPKLLALRELLFQTAAATAGVGEIEETLKWGEPAYVTKNKSGSTVRMDWKQKAPDHYALYFHCQTDLVETFRTLFPDDFAFDGNRALIFAIDDPIPKDAVAMCLARALTHHLKAQLDGNQRRKN